MDKVEHVGTDEWLRVAGETFCLRGAGRPVGTKAGQDDYFACALPPGHEGDCIFMNASALETELAKREKIRP